MCTCSGSLLMHVTELFFFSFPLLDSIAKLGTAPDLPLGQVRSCEHLNCWHQTLSAATLVGTAVMWAAVLLTLLAAAPLLLCWQCLHWLGPESVRGMARLWLDGASAITRIY